MFNRQQVSASELASDPERFQSAGNRRIALVLLAQRMSRVVQFFRVVGKNVTLFCRQLAALKSQAHESFTHPHKIFNFGSHGRGNVQDEGLLQYWEHP